MLLLKTRLRNLLIEREEFQLQTLPAARARGDAARVSEIQSILFDINEQLAGLRLAILSTIDETQRATMLSRESWAGWSAVFNAIEGGCRALELQSDNEDGGTSPSSIVSNRLSVKRVAEEVAATIQ